MGPVSVVDGHFEASAYDRFLEADVLVIGDFVSATQAGGTWYSYAACHGTWEASYSP